MVDGSDQAMAASCLVHQNWVPSIQMQRTGLAHVPDQLDGCNRADRKEGFRIA